MESDGWGKGVVGRQEEIKQEYERGAMQGSKVNA